MLPEGYANEMAIEKFKAEMNANEMHPMASSGPEAWEAWVLDVANAHPDEWKDAVNKLGLTTVKYTDLTHRRASEFVNSVEDRIAWAAKGMTVKKKGKRK